MKWKQKSRIQNLVAKLPSSLGYATYYWLQRRFGGLGEVDPTSRLVAGCQIARFIDRQEQRVEAKTFLEIGTGRRLNLPIALWLLGASRIVTVDLNPYLKAELVFEDIAYMKAHRNEIEKLFEKAQRPVFAERFHQLIRVQDHLPDLLAMTNIQYLAPVDATRLDLEPQSIDYHVSYATLEHIPPKSLARILQEGKRLLRQGGLFVHFVDFSDHFSHSDHSISAANFLQFSDKAWERWAGNRYMYHNRLRVDDFVDLFGTANLRIVALDTTINEQVLEQLADGFPLDDRFQGKRAETNATVSAWIVAADGEIA
jgi:SAM-dependent methyltransferase